MLLRYYYIIINLYVYQLTLPCQKSSPVQSCSSPTAHECFQLVCLGRCPDEAGGQPAGRDQAGTTRSVGVNVLVLLQLLIWLDCSHLTGVHWDGDVGGLRQELGGPQQVAHPLQVPLVLLDGLDVHLLFGQQRLVARRVASRGQELEVSVAAAQQEAHPEVRKAVKLSQNSRRKSIFLRQKNKTLHVLTKLESGFTAVHSIYYPSIFICKLLNCKRWSLRNIHSFVMSVF